MSARPGPSGGYRASSIPTGISEPLRRMMHDREAIIRLPNQTG